SGGALTSSKFDLTLHLYDDPQGLRGLFEYATDLFDAATIERMAAHWEVILEGIVEAPDRRVANISILTWSERQRLVEWNDTRDESPGTCLEDMFEAQAAKTPEAVALVSGDEQLTYRELDERADALAAGLRRLGVGPEEAVAVCLERSPAWVVAMLGVLKAGGIYVPIAVDDPPKRRALLVEEARPKVVLTHERFDALVASPAPHAERRVATPPESGAWVIYTSGSTGRPKGVVVSHRSATHQLAVWQALHPVGPQDAILVSSAISFDLSILQVLWPLLAGGRMVLIDEDGHRDPAVLAGAIRRHCIAKLVLVPSMLRMVLAEAEREALPSLKAVFVGGEALPLDLAREVHRIVPQAELFNVYGPTEATILATAWPCPRDPPRILIGKPVPGTSAYVLDAALEPVPYGVPGVLYLGGPAVARGYLGRPEVTAETFVPDPFSAGVPGARLYRTGDTARRHPSGDIEFLGRADHQVKLRGYRIELGEIEAALVQYGNIGETIVLVRGAETGHARLVAYVTPVTGTAPAPKQVQAYLRQRLPASMVPTAYVVMDRLPRMAS
ncbi:MAG TPA: amino acid adenylation domain-containing protein, partial [Kofleriaceae bacterium]